ncbi:MAG TPA: family 16 glycosylhydrolase [Cellvibrio sp.]|nr:family 16 glycosylhydrolase [Cellvibrio sp.]
MKKHEYSFKPALTRLCLSAAVVSLIGCGGSGGGSSSSAPASSVALSSIAPSSVAKSSMAPSSATVSSIAPSSLASSSASSSAAMPSSQAASSSSSAGTGWALVWSDEFDGTRIDSSKWSHEKNCSGGGNNELQCYTDRADNSFVENGKLTIVAKQETFSGQAKVDDDPGYDVNDKSVTRDYTSARLRSKNKGDWKYGRMEISAKMPQGQGIWPALWMLPTEWKYGSWPLSGEIDIFEAVNSNTGSFGNTVHGTLHFGRAWPNNAYIGDDHVPATNIWDEFHTYAVEWEDGEIRWYVDDVHFATQTKDGWYNYYWAGQTEGYKIGEGAAPFDQLFHMIMNVAVGGNWPGNPNAQTIFPQKMEVDYVRVYECTKDKLTGKGCASNVSDTLSPLIGVAKPQKNEFSLFKNGTSYFEFDVKGTKITNTLLATVWDNNTPGNVVATPGLALGDELVWDIAFNATPGNTFLMSGDMSAQTLVDNGFKFTNLMASGELKFDLYVDAIQPSTTLLVKVDSGWPNVSYAELKNLQVGAWQSVSVNLADLKPNNIDPGAVNPDRVINPFVIEAVGGTAHIKINNLRISCLANCAVNPVLKGLNSTLTESVDVFVDEVAPHWDFGIGEWQTGGDHIDTAIVDSDDAARGKVLDIKFKTADQNGVAFIQATSTKNVTAFAADGYLEFDMKVVDYGNNTSGIVIKADCVNPCSSGDIPLGFVADGQWETFKIPVANMVSGGLVLSKVNTPFIILPTWGSQHGVHVQLDNIRWIKP